MPNSSELEALIRRLENLDGPDRDVDVAVGIALGVFIEDPDAASYGPYLRKRLARRCAAYTASIDAAVALVERCLPGWRIENLCEWDAPKLRERGPWTCDLMRRGQDFKDHFPAKCAHAPTPAIALCLALLRALSERQQERGG